MNVSLCDATNLQGESSPTQHVPLQRAATEEQLVHAISAGDDGNQCDSVVHCIGMIQQDKSSLNSTAERLISFSFDFTGKIYMM